MTDHTAATPLDLAAIRADYPNAREDEGCRCGCGDGGWHCKHKPRVLALCDEVERLRAENATLTKAAARAINCANRHDALVASHRAAVVEAAVAWRENVAAGCNLEPMQDSDKRLLAAISAYEQEKQIQKDVASMAAFVCDESFEDTGSQPSPPEDASGRGIAPSTAAGDLGPPMSVVDLAQWGTNITGGYAATIARLRAALNAAADALHDIGWNVEPPGCDRDVIAREAHAARDAARKAAQEGE